MKQKFKTTSFWLGLSGAIVIILDTLSNMIGIDLHSCEAESIVLSIASILVLFGIITKKNVDDKTESKSEDLLVEIKNKDDLE